MLDSATHNGDDDAKRRSIPLLAPLLLVLALSYLYWQPADIATLLAWGERYASEPLALIALVLIQGLMFALALPGSLMLWLVAPFLPPLLATGVLLSGSLLGVLGGYFIVQTPAMRARSAADSWLMRIIARRSDFFTQMALRVAPGCPHWMVNYAAGMLRLPLPTVMAAATIGLSVKWLVYATAVHGAAEAATTQDGIALASLMPLIALTLFLLLGALLRERLSNAPKAGAP